MLSAHAKAYYAQWTENLNRQKKKRTNKYRNVRIGQSAKEKRWNGGQNEWLLKSVMDESTNGIHISFLTKVILLVDWVKMLRKVIFNLQIFSQW